MFNGVYTAASGMITQMNRVNNITNNISNVNTPGFKREGINIKSWSRISGFSNLKLPLEPDTDKSKGFINETINSVAHMDKSYIDFSKGPFKRTGNDLDFSIEGSGFFAVLTPNGVAYTKDGEFSINKDGVLVQRGTGYPVLGENYFKNSKLIKLTGLKNTIEPDGAVKVDGAKVDTIAIRNFNNYSNLIHNADNTFSTTNNEQPVVEKNFKLDRGYLETSNVKIVREMVSLIEAQRSFDRYQKVIDALGNDLASDVIEKISRVA